MINKNLNLILRPTLLLFSTKSILPNNLLVSFNNLNFIVETKPTIVTSPAQTMNFKKLLDSYMRKPSSAAKSDSQ